MSFSIVCDSPDFSWILECKRNFTRARPDSSWWSLAQMQSLIFETAKNPNCALIANLDTADPAKHLANDLLRLHQTNIRWHRLQAGKPVGNIPIVRTITDARMTTTRWRYEGGFKCDLGATKSRSNWQSFPTLGQYVWWWWWCWGM